MQVLPCLQLMLRLGFFFTGMFLAHAALSAGFILNCKDVEKLLEPHLGRFGLSGVQSI